VQSCANASKPDRGLANWPGSRLRKADVGIVKSYLNEEELDTLTRIVATFLDQAEFRTRRRQIVYMAGIASRRSLVSQKTFRKSPPDPGRSREQG
jgi:hypothetical protein